MAAFKGVINCVYPNAAIYSFDANMVMSAGDLTPNPNPYPYPYP